MSDLHSINLRRLSILDGDIEPLQNLFLRCTDYHELEEGESTVDDAAEYLLKNVPPDTAGEDKIVLGMFDSTGLLVAVCDLLRNYPLPREWWIGLLMIDPNHRGTGLGSQIIADVIAMAGAENATALWVAPLEQNPNAQRFWERHGFVEERRAQTTTRSGRTNNVVVRKKVTK
ncbi:MAG TPA: GNAT family N-acetyltransferase [Candidatus Didemnitutus sp.]|nr:GNAT family N-acetyltransferase [Candidatus Didemnitutus sp.]